MKRLIISLLIFCLVLFGTSLLIFYFSKANLVTDTSAKRFISTSLQYDLIIANAPCDERRAVAQRIKQLNNRHFTHLIIGSSRVMQLGKFTGFNNALNLGVSGASYEDLKIILDLVKLNQITFDSLHLDFNPWYASPSNDQRFLYFDQVHNIESGLKDIVLFRYSKSDFKSIIPSLNYKIRTLVPEKCNDHIIFSDGSIKQKSHGEEKRIKNLNYSIKNLYHKIREFYVIDEKYLSQVFQFYHEVSSQYPTTIYLSPFHPLLFQTYPQDSRIQNILKTENLFRKHCGDIPAKGSFVNQTSYIDVPSEMFLDAMHISEVAIRKYFTSHPGPR